MVETKEPNFNPELATFMDFRVSQKHGTAFIYLMPTSTTTALVEYTLFTEELLQQLKKGVTIPVKDGEPYIAVPDSIEIVNDVTDHYIHMDDFRQQYPHTWLLMSLTEGKFHQVRKMCLAINRRCLRLIRISIEDLKLGDLQPGCVKEFEEQAFFKLIGVEYAS